MDNQEILRQLVNREVVYCASCMMQALLEAAAERGEIGGYAYEELLEVCERRSDNAKRIEELEGHIEELEILIEERDELIEERDELDGDPAQSQYELARIATQLDDINVDIDRLGNLDELQQELDDLENEEPEDVFEHWIVTPFFARKLQEQGEAVAEIFDFHIWGRTTTGQAIYMDSVIERVAQDMEILKGQRHDWSQQCSTSTTG